MLICLAVVIPAAGFAASFSEAPQHEALVNPVSNGDVAPPIESGASCQTASETGFEVCDDTNANFLSAYLNYGVQNVGYPISTRYKRDGFITQAFQKAIFQWRADTGTVAFKNVFDELSNQGLNDRLLSSRQTPHPLPADWDGDIPFAQVVQKRQALLTRAALQTAYFAASDPLTFFGLPTSEVQDMGNHYAIRLQRAVLQEWKEDVSWASIGEVTIANGGDIAKEMGALPAFALAPGGAPVASAPAAPTVASAPAAPTVASAPAAPTVAPAPAAPTVAPAPAPAAPAPAPVSARDTERKLDPRLEALGVTIQEANVAPGEPYWRLIEVFWHNEKEAGGRHHIYVDVKDESGTNLAGQAIRFAWGSGELVLPSSTNFPMYAAGHSYSVEILGMPSDVVGGIGLGTPDQRYHTIHTEFFVRFQRAIK